MPRPGSIRRSLLGLMLSLGPIGFGVGCSSKPAEVDTAIVSPDPAVKPAPAPALTPGADGATTPSPSTTSPSSPPQGEPTKP